MIERTGRVLAPVAIALFALAALALTTVPIVPAATAAAVAIVGSTLLSAYRPTDVVLVAGAVLVGAALTLLCSGQSSNVGWFAICVLVGWVAFSATTRAALVAGGIAIAGFLAQLTLVHPDGGWVAWISGTVFTLVACLMAGRQRDLLEQLRAAQASLADRTRTEERTRIAHEMHDIIGHALTVALLHISSARLAVDEAPDVARSSLAEAEQQTRRSLEDVRASVGLLREHTETAPLPGGADLDDLVESFRRAGARVSWELQGDIGRLSAATGLAAYRIVQESLTNAARHAPAASAEVRVRVADTVTIVVDSDGRATGRGHHGAGLVGMRERAEAVGGRCDAGPAGHGWRVEAVLPR